MTRRRWSLLALTAAAIAWAIGAEWVSIRYHVGESHFIDLIGGLSFQLAGVVALDRRPGNRIGWLMVAFGSVGFLGNYGNLQLPLLPLLGVVGSQLAGAPILAHIALAYPTGHLRSRFDTGVLSLTYTVAAACCAVVLLTFDPRASGCRCAWEPAPFPSRTGETVRLALLVSQRSAFVLVPLFLLAVWLRWRRASVVERRALLPLWAAACVIALIYLAESFASASPADEFSYLLWELQTLFSISVPLLFLWGLLSSQLARSAVSDLVVELERPMPPGELRARLATALGDPALQLLYAVDAPGRWAGADGRPAVLPARQAVVTVAGNTGRPLAALIHDPAIDPGLVRAVAAAASMRIENERLHADVRAQLDEVRASRQRIVEAGDRERRRVERNLHDGAQQRLAALALSLALLRERAGPGSALAESIDQTTQDLRCAIAELRELARGIHPAILTEEGLTAAVESLADRSSIPVRVIADLSSRLPEPVEAVAYFVVSESMANVLKYSGASGARVELARRSGSLLVEVADDGVGGADTARGSGLRGLADRVTALRGTFEVDSPLAGGTRIRAEIPCEP